MMLKSKKVMTGIAMFLTFILLSGVSIFAQEVSFNEIVGGHGQFGGWLQLFQPTGPNVHRRVANASTLFIGAGPAHNNTTVIVSLVVTDIATQRQLFTGTERATWTTGSPGGLVQPRVSAPNLTASCSIRGVRANSTHTLTGPISRQRTLTITR